MPKLNEMCMKILKVMQDHPAGITEGEIRAVLQIPAEEQSNFGRRRRELHSVYKIEKRKDGARTLYVYKGELETEKDSAQINSRLRAHVLHLAKGRCAMCGRTIEEHGVVLHVDHKIPRDLGGKTELENLWALCATCNQGKKNLFASVDNTAMVQAMMHKSVHMKLGEALKAANGQPVSAILLHFVANQDDWKKRIRELRYLGWEISARNSKDESGRVVSFYTLLKHEAWPADPTGEIRRYERDRAARNRNGD